jgi:UDP-glucose 4-epimerase
MNCLVLGGTGFIGRHLCAALIAAGHRVRAFARFSHEQNRIEWPEIVGIEWRKGDFCNPAETALALHGMDIVFHLVSGTLPKTSNDNPLLDLQTNVVPTLQLLEAMIRQPVPPRIVFLSSGGTVYGVPQEIPIPESHRTEPLCAYGIGKLAIEKYLMLYHRLHGLDCVILRLANPYGEGQRIGSRQGVIPAFLWKALHREPLEIWGDGSVVRDYIYIDDAVASIMAAAGYYGKERIFNIGSGTGYSLKELVAIICDLLKQDIPCRYLSGRACDSPVNILDIDRAVRELCWRPRVTVGEGVAQMAAFFRAAGWFS